MSYKEQLEKLKKRLEGKIVTSVSEGTGADAICKITLSDGSGFRLHATDLGFWTENAENEKGHHTTLDSLFIAYEHHEYNLAPKYNFKEIPKPKVKIDEGGMVIVTAHDGKVFLADSNCFNEWEKKVLNHKSGLKLLISALKSGLCWRGIFSSGNKSCPKELYYKGAPAE